MQSVSIQPSDPTTPGAIRLIQQLDAYLNSIYPPESNHLMSVEALRQPYVQFLTVQMGKQIVGCGALVNHGDYGEIKRFFVLPEFRGMQLGQQLLQALETRAMALNLPYLRLETGVSQPEALGLFAKLGYQQRGPFGQYEADAYSVFVEKSLN